MKKIISMVLVAAMTVMLMLSGCGKDEKLDPKRLENLNTEGFPIVKEKITLSMMGFRHPIQGPWDQLKFFKTMEEKTNIAFTFDTPPSDSFEEKKNLAFTSDQYPDVFFAANLTPQQEVKYGGEGVLIPLEKLIDKYAPNVKKMFDAMPDVKKSLTAPDGHIYSLPNINKASIAVTGTIWVNGPWMDALGVKELPNTVDGLYDLLKRIKAEDPNKNNKQDEIPFGIHGKNWEFNSFFLPAFGIVSPKIYVENDKVLYGYLQPNYKEYIKYMNKLWKEKLIDQDAFTQGYPELAAKGKANQVGMAAHAIPQLIYECKTPQDATKYPVLPCLTSSVNSTPVTAIGTGINRGAFAITNKCKYPEAVMRWVDWLYSEEGSIYIHYGEEGDLWKFNDKKLREYIQPADGRNTEEYRGGVITPDCGSACPKWVRDETEGSWDDVAQQFRIKETDEKMFKFGKVAYPLTYNTPDEQSTLDTLLTDIDKYTEQMEAKFITGEASLAEYDKFVETLKKMGVEDVIKAYQDAYNRWKKVK